MICLSAEKINKSFDGKAVLKDVSITLESGELVCLLGISGVGKTTLFNTIAGIELPDSGRIVLNGTDITGTPGHISYMLQKDLLFPYKKVLDNVVLPLIIGGEKKKTAKEKANKLFPVFGLDGTQSLYPHELSGGMRQRAALLRTYLASDGVALLDEPFSALDTITKTQIHKWYLDIMQKINLSTLFITHDIDEAILLSDRIYILGGRPGGIIAEIPISEKKPRQEDFVLSKEFIDYKRSIIEQMNI